MDPVLQESDPIAQFIARMKNVQAARAAQSTSATSLSSRPSSPALNEPSDDEDGLGNSISNANATQFTPTLNPQVNAPDDLSRTLSHLAHQLTRELKLAPGSQAELDRFCMVNSVPEHFLIMMAKLCKIHELLQDIDSEDDNWKIPEALKKSTKQYCNAFILSPTTTAYRGDGQDHVLNAMRELKVTGVPLEKDVAHVAIFLKHIGSCLTTARNDLKTSIKASLEPESDLRNVAALAAHIVRKTRIKPTVQLYMRLAFIRYQVTSYPGLDDNFWLKVDEQLAVFRKSFTTEFELSQAFTELYNEDKKKYGDPAESNFRAAEAIKLDDYQKTLNSHAQHIRSEEEIGGRRKRKRF